MRARTLGSSGLTLSELGLGTWGLCGDGYGPVAEVEQDRVIGRAMDLGITCFETAASYAHGEMERRLGRHLVGRPEVRVVTKLGTDRDGRPPRKRFDRAFLEAQLAGSLDRLGRQPLDVVLLHHPAAVTIERDEATGTMAELQGRGLLSRWGVSTSQPEVARAALRRGARVVSMPFNAFHAAPVHALEEELSAAGAGLLAHSPLAYGLLAGLWAHDHDFPPGDHRAERWSPAMLRLRLRQLAALRPLVGGEISTLRGAALRFVLAHPCVTSTLLGPRSVVQLDQLVREAGREPPYLAPAQLTALSARLRELGVER